MTNIIKELKKRNITSQIRYYGLNDMATGFEIKNIVDNYEVYNELLNSVIPKITNIDEYVDFLYIECLSKYIEIIPNVRDDIREKVKLIIEKAEKKSLEYSKSDLAKFITNNYKQIFNEEYKELYIKFDVIDFTIDYICQLCSKKNEIIEYIINNYSYKVYDKFDRFKKLFKEPENLYFYDLLLTKEKLKKDSIYRLDKIGEVLEYLRKKDENKYTEKLNILLCTFKDETFGATYKNVMNKYFRLKAITELLNQLHYPKISEFEKELKNQKNLLDEYILKDGHRFSYNIDIKPIVEVLEDKNLKWYTKTLSLTHTTYRKKRISVFENLLKKEKAKGITDFITTNIDTDEIFTYSIINSLSIILMYGKYTLNYVMLKDQMLNDVLGYIIMGVFHYFGDMEDFNKENFELDINMIYDGLRDLNVAYNQKEQYKIKRILYGLEMQLCGVIEKLLRFIYKKANNEQEYISYDSLSLHCLLTDDLVQKEIGKENCYCIQYLLSKRNGNIGNNTRNIFAHYSDDVYNKLNIDTVLETLYILLVISNVLLCKRKRVKK